MGGADLDLLYISRSLRYERAIPALNVTCVLSCSTCEAIQALYTLKEFSRALAVHIKTCSLCVLLDADI